MNMRHLMMLVESKIPSQYPLDSKNGWYANADYEVRGGKMVTMSPDEYLSKVRPLVVDEISRENIDDLKAHMLAGRKLDPLTIYANGKEDGRHRAHAAKELGIKKVPVIVFQSLGEMIEESFSLEATPLSDEDILAANLPSNVRAKLFANRDLPDGKKVAVRLNLNGKVGKYFLQTVHDKTSSGPALGYDGAVTVRNATFSVSQRARELIASKQENKFPMAAVVGTLAQVPADLTGTEIRFNPMAEHLFTDLDGHAVKSAEEVTVFNTRCFARGRIEYWREDEAPIPLGEIPSSVKFKKDA